MNIRVRFGAFALVVAVATHTATAQAIPDSRNCRRSSRSGSRQHDDQGICPDGRPDGLLLGLAAGCQRQPRRGLFQSARAWPGRWRPADRLRRDCHADRLRHRRTSASSPARTRTSCMAPASCRWTRSLLSSRCRTSATASGSMRCMTHAPTSSPRSASNTAPSPASTWSSARTGRARRRLASRRWCALPRRWCLPFRAFSWTTRRRIARPSSRCSARSTSIRCRSSTGR